MKWFHNDEEITSDLDVSIEGDGTFSRLTIKKIDSTKSGTYRVEASNKCGSDMADFELNVTGLYNILACHYKFQ